MKKVLLSVAIVAFSSTVVLAQGKMEKPAATAEASVPMKFNEETHDFGTLKQGAPATFEFTYKNTGKTPLIIQNAQGSCGCTVPTYSKEPVAPKKSGSIKVTYDSNRIGPINKQVTVTTNAGVKVIYIKGNIEAAAQSSVPSTTSMMKK